MKTISLNNGWINKIVLVHKIYGWLTIAMSLIALTFVILGYSFGSLLSAFGERTLGNVFQQYYYIGITISFLFGFFNIFIAKKLLENKQYAQYLSFLSIVLMIVFFSTYLHYFFALIITLLWLLHFKITDLKYYNIRIIALLVIFLGGYFGYMAYQNKKAEDFCTLVYDKSYEEINKKLENGYNPDSKSKKGLPALFYAENPNKAKLLLEYGANPNYEDSYKQTPIFSLMISKENYKQFLDILVQHGANINHQDIFGDTVLHHSVFWGRYERILAILDHNPDLTLKNKTGETAVDIAIRTYKSKKDNSSEVIMKLLKSKSQGDPFIESITLSIFRDKLNKGEDTSLKVMAKYQDDTKKDVTDYVSWVTEPNNSVKIIGHTLTALNDVNTTIKAKLGSLTSNAVSVELYWEENGYKLPSQVNSMENYVSILGVDNNNNVIRDDIERFIFNTYERHISCWQKESNVTLPSGEIMPVWSKVCDDKENHYRDIALKAAETVQKVLQNIEMNETEKDYLYTAIDCSIYFSNDRPKMTRGNSSKEDQILFNSEKEEITLMGHDMLNEREKLLNNFFDTDIRKQKYQEYNSNTYHQNINNKEFQNCREKVEALYGFLH